VAAVARLPPGLGRGAVAGGLRVPRAGLVSPTIDWADSPVCASPTIDWADSPDLASPTIDWADSPDLASPTIDWADSPDLASPTIDRGALDGVTAAKTHVLRAACTPPVTNLRHVASWTRPVGRSGRPFAANWAGGRGQRVEAGRQPDIHR